MKRIVQALAGLTLAAGVIGLPLSHSAFAARSGHLRPSQSAPTSSNPAGKTTLVAFVASVVGVTPTVLEQDLQAGQTLLQIAGSKYASADALATALLAPLKTKLDAAVTANKITSSQAATFYDKAHAVVAKLVVTPHPRLGALFAGLHTGKAGGHRGHAGIGSGMLLSTLVTTCNTTAANLQAAIKAGGKSLLAICQSTNPSVTQQSLVTALINSIKTKLDAAVTAKKITAAQETAILSKLQTRLNTWVTTTIPVGGPQHR